MTVAAAPSADPGARPPWPARAWTLVRRGPFEVGVALVALVYWALALSPSSYGLALGFFGVQDTHTWLGTPKLERWDEWAIQTPLVQAIVHAGHGSVNTTSYYEESFRNLVALPLYDWALVFRPFQWAYLVLPPAWGFSFYWAASFGLTIVGWTLLLRRLGVRYWLAVAASLAIFFAPFTQAWWSGLAPMNALFPWIVLLLASRIRLVVAAPLMTWLVASWVVSSAYLPGLILYGFVGLVLVVGFVIDRGTWKRLAVLAAAGAVGGGIALVYLAPVLRTLSQTVYPGQRVVAGGSLPIAQWFSQFAPFGVTRGWSGLVSTNLPEAVALGSWLPLLALCLIDWRRLRRDDLRRAARPLGACALGFLALSAWQVSGAGHLFGVVFGWNRAAEQRSLLASGLLLVVLSVTAMSKLPVRVTWVRVVAFGVAAAAVSLLAAALADTATRGLLGRAHDDLWILPVVVVVAVVLFVLAVRGRTADGPRADGPAEGRARQPRRDGRRAGLVALAVGVPAIAIWALYNPVQDSRIIFDKPHTDVTAMLDAAAAQRPDGAVAANFPGATLNGQGYRSIIHALPLPQLDDFRAMFPDLPEDQLNEIFNRYLELTLVDADQPELLGQGIAGIPRQRAAELATIPGG